MTSERKCGLIGMWARFSMTRFRSCFRFPHRLALFTSRRPLNAQRAALAEEVNNVLSRCISVSGVVHYEDEEDSSKSVSLRQFMKNGMTKAHVFRVVQLTQSLDNHLIVPRTARFLNAQLKDPSSVFGHRGSNVEGVMHEAPNFSSYETSVWYGILSALFLCVVIIDMLLTLSFFTTGCRNSSSAKQLVVLMMTQAEIQG
jgi:hypothetical protein